MSKYLVYDPYRRDIVVITENVDEARRLARCAANTSRSAVGVYRMVEIASPVDATILIAD